MSAYQPKTGAKCSCKPGVQRDNCPNCEGTGMVIDFAAIRARNVKPKPEECVGRFARSIESGWLGKIIEVVNVTNTKGGRILKSSETMFRMKGVNTLCHLIQGGDMNDFLDDDDVQWFAPADVRFVKVV